MRSDLERILASSSPLSAQVRSLLHGFLGGLEASLAQTTLDDLARIYAERTVRDLQSLLQTKPQISPPLESFALPIPAPQIESLESLTPNPPADRDDVLELATQMMQSPTLLAELDEFQLPPTTDATFWRSVQLLLLRVPAAIRDEWLSRWLELNSAPTSKFESLLGLSEEIVYPAWRNSSGLRLAPRTPLHPRLQQLGAFPETEPMVQVVSALLGFVDREPNLRHVYRPLYSFGFAPIDDRFITELCERLRRVVNSLKDADLTKQLRARLDLDEAIHSLTFDPVPALDSWWVQFQSRSRETLFSLRETMLQRGINVHLQILLDQYSENRNFTRDDLGVDRGGKPGDVVACLRVFARIEQQALPGRVLYRRV